MRSAISAFTITNYISRLRGGAQPTRLTVTPSKTLCSTTNPAAHFPNCLLQNYQADAVRSGVAHYAVPPSSFRRGMDDDSHLVIRG